MNKTTLAAIILIILLIVGYVFWQNEKSIEENRADQVDRIGQMTNGDMIRGENGADDGSIPGEIIGENVSYFASANGYFVRPEAEGDYPGVILIHENRGLRPEIRLMADELAKEGYLVLAVDLFGGKVVETQDEARVLTANFNQQTGTANMKAAVAYLKNRGASKIASLGWCFGGAQSLQLALSGEQMDATAIYYGRLATTTAALAPIRWPVLGVFGGADQSISVESVNQFEASLDSLNVPNEIYIYPGVGHAFANPSGMNYAPNETRDAWQKTIAFLETHLK